MGGYILLTTYPPSFFHLQENVFSASPVTQNHIPPPFFILPMIVVIVIASPLLGNITKRYRSKDDGF